MTSPFTQGSFAAGVVQPPSIRIHGTSATFVSEPGTDVYYTFDGREPTMHSQLAPHDGPVELGRRTLIIKAVAVRDGVRSAPTTQLFQYTPRPLVILPEDGPYDGEVTVQMVSEHDDVRYTLDGTVPTSLSASYEIPFKITDEGRTVVTAAMFFGDRVLGSVARRTYDVAQAKLDPPIVTPHSGSYTLPLRIAVQHDHVVRYTLDGTEPTLRNGVVYTSPIVVLQEGEVTFQCRAFVSPAIGGPRAARPSELVTTTYRLSLSGADPVSNGADAGNAQSRLPITVLPVSNIEFNDSDAKAATAAAEETAAMIEAAQSVMQDVQNERESLTAETRNAKRKHRELLDQLDVIQKELGIAVARKALLQGQVARESESVVRTREKLEQVQHEQLDLKQKIFSCQVEATEAERFVRQAAAERQAILRQQESLTRKLEEAYLANKKALSEIGPSLGEEVAEASAAVAEQRHELWLLKETISSLHQTLQKRNHKDPLHSVSEFLPEPPVIDIPVVEAKVPIPRGKMRLITGPTGNGLQQLRDAHKVQANIVSQDSELCVRVYGHAKGVHNLIAQLGRLLNE